MSSYLAESSQDIVISQAYQTTDSGDPWPFTDDDFDRPLPSLDALTKAALATHRLCQASAFTHAFFGGFELAILGNTRGTKDVDVEIARPSGRSGAFERVHAAFTNDPEFMVLEGVTPDGVSCAFAHRYSKILFRLFLNSGKRIEVFESRYFDIGRVIPTICTHASPLSFFILSICLSPEPSTLNGGKTYWCFHG